MYMYTELCFDELFDLLQRAIESDKNKRNIAYDKTPSYIFNLEDPIASSKLFGYDVSEKFYQDSKFYAEQCLRQKLWRFENFPQDLLILDTDISSSIGMYVEYTFLDMGLYFDQSGVPVIDEHHPLTQSKDLSVLKPVDFKTSGWMPRLLKWHDELCRIGDGRLNVLFPQWWRGPLDLAIQLRGYENLMADVAEDPDFVHDLLKFITEQRMRWTESYAAYFGVDIPQTGIGDDWINIPFITPTFFEEFLLPRYMEIAAFQNGVTSIHSCGNQTPVQRFMPQIKGLRSMEISPWTDLALSMNNIPLDMPIAINLHPSVLLETDTAIRANLELIRNTLCSRQYSVTTSGLTPIGQLEQADAFVSRINQWISIAADVFEG